MCKIDYNLLKSFEISNHIKLDSRFVINCNRLSVVKSDLSFGLSIVCKKSIEIVNHMKLDSRFLIDCNRLSDVKADLYLKLIIICKDQF